MPVQDWICPNCSTLIPDQYHPSHRAILACPSCSFAMERSWQRPPRPLFIPFTTNDGREISSLHDIRRHERDSEKAARDGRGQRIVFREYSQDSSNKDVNTLAKEGVQQKLPTLRRNVTPRRLGRQRPSDYGAS